MASRGSRNNSTGSDGNEDRLRASSDAAHGMLSHGVRTLCGSNHQTHQTEADETQATWHQAAAQERQKVLNFVLSENFRNDVASALHVARWFAHTKTIL